MFLTYNPVAGCFVHAGADPLAKQTDAALNSARALVSQDAWKRGHSFELQNGPTMHAIDALSAFDGGIVQTCCGRLNGVFKSETKDDAGNIYSKMRLVFNGKSEENDVLSLEMGHEMTQQLIQRILNVKRGDFLIIKPTIESVDRNGRIYANHNCIVKTEDDQLLLPVSGLWKKAQAEANQAALKLQEAGFKEAKMLNTAKAQKKVAFHSNLLDGIIARFSTSPKTPTPVPAPTTWF